MRLHKFKVVGSDASFRIVRTEKKSWDDVYNAFTLFESAKAEMLKRLHQRQVTVHEAIKACKLLKEKDAEHEHL